MPMTNRSILPISGNINTHLISYSLHNILRSIDEAFRHIQPTPSPRTPERSSSFLDLPAEMRIAIYEAAILEDPEGGSYSDKSDNLLQICRQVRAEAEPIQYQRPQSFTSQAKLFHWLDRSQPANLHKVRTLTLYLTDVDLSRFLDPGITSPQTHLTVWSLYQDELRRLEDALCSLPNLSSLTIIPPRYTRSALLRWFYYAFLKAIPYRCPTLKRLELHDTKDVLIGAPVLNSIGEVIFTERRTDDAGAGVIEAMTSPRTTKFYFNALPLSTRTSERIRVKRAVSY